MTLFRLVACALLFYNVGNADWRATVACAVIWAGVELGTIWTRHYERREAEMVAKARDALHRLNGGDPFHW
jgi:hypothetical protein